MTPGEAENASDELRLAQQALKSAGLLLETSALEDAASRLYYSAFHAARAALAVKGLFAKTHAGLLTLYSDTFGPGPLLRRLFQVRSQADYEMKRFTLDAADLAGMIQEVTEFFEKVRADVSEVLASGPDEPDPPPDR